MPGGAPFKPELRRYDAIHCGGTAVYLAEFGTDCVKVGCTIMPRHRLRTLHGQAKKVGRPLGKVVVFPVDRDHFHAETRCIKALRGVASNLEGRREYFTGVSFEDARALLAVLLPPSQPQEA